MLCGMTTDGLVTQPASAAHERRDRIRRPLRQLRPARDVASWRRAKKAPSAPVRPQGRRRGLALPHGRQGLRSTRSRRPSASATCGTPSRSSSRTRPASSSSRPRAASRATSSASSTPPRTCASASSRRPRRSSAASSTSSSSSATTTTRRWAATPPPCGTSCAAAPCSRSPPSPGSSSPCCRAREAPDGSGLMPNIPNSPLFPEQGSDIARVGRPPHALRPRRARRLLDAHRGPRPRLHGQVPPQARGRGRRGRLRDEPEVADPRARLVRHPARPPPHPLRLGHEGLLRPEPSAGRAPRSTGSRAASGCGRSSTRTAAARSTSCTSRAGRPSS